jgi:hypothetical protein
MTNHKTSPTTTATTTTATMPATSAAWKEAITGIEGEISVIESRQAELVGERASLRLKSRFGSTAATARIAAIDAELAKLQTDLADAVTDSSQAQVHRTEAQASEAAADEDRRWQSIAALYAKRDEAASKADAALQAAAEAIQTARQLQTEVQALLPPELRDRFTLGRTPVSLALAHHGFSDFCELAALGPAYSHRATFLQTLQAYTRTQPAAAPTPAPSAASTAWMTEAEATAQARPRVA